MFQESRVDRNKVYLIIIQLFLFLIGTSFSAGGGNIPGNTSNDFGFIKAVFLLIPLFLLLYNIIIKPNISMQKILEVLLINRIMIIYYLICFFTLFFAYNWEYSLLRLAYTILGFCSLIGIIAQYFIYFNNKKDYLNYIINNISFLMLIFPIYVLISNNLNLSNFRSDLQSLNLIHPNILASFYGHLFVWHLCCLFLNRSDKIMNTLYLFTLLFFEYLIFSRTTIIALCLLLGLFPFITFVYKKNIKSVFLIIFLVLIACTGLILNLMEIISFQQILDLFIRNDDRTSLLTLTNRTTLWGILIDNLSIKTFFSGYGYSVINEDYGVNFGSGILYGAHNAYLSILLGSGIAALIAVISYLLKNIFIVFNHKNISEPLSYILISSYFLFIVSCISSEEIGINFSLSFSYLIFITTIIFKVRKI